MSDLTQFDLASAYRVARVVRHVEGDYRRARPLSFFAILDSSKRAVPVFRIATFSGAWNKNTSKTVTHKYSAETASALNLFANVPAPTGTGDCAIARDGTAWFLIAAVC
jgi:hypothetical protein